MSTRNLLVELFVEELPPKALKLLGQEFAKIIASHLINRCQLSTSFKYDSFATPRRLAVLIYEVADCAPDRVLEISLMPASVGLTLDGQPTPALVKKLAANGEDETAVPRLTRDTKGKSETLVLKKTVSGMTLKDGLQQALEEMLRTLPIPKVMSYQLADGWSTVSFVRPAHGLVTLHGTTVVSVSILGLKAGRATHGHRFETKISKVNLKNADSYAQQLEKEGAVIASFDARRKEIERQLREAATKTKLKPVEDDALLDEVTALVERPNVLTCQFEKEYLEVPQECLILTMKANQKYFPLLDANGKLSNKFLVVSNIRPKNPSKVIEGNERVVRPRLADAKFFFDQDRKHSLKERIPRLEKIIYHQQLGSQWDRVKRVRFLAHYIGLKLGDPQVAERAAKAAELAKTDLVTNMVSEFPELQGIMGRYYALNDSQESELAEAIREQYLPRGAGDQLPATKTGMALALADKLETLCGIFFVGQKPTGAKDPFGLRRAAIGVLRICIELKLPIDLKELISDAQGVIREFRAEQVQPTSVGDGVIQMKLTHDYQLDAEVYNYIMERMRGYYLEDRKQFAVTPEMFDAVLANRPASPFDFDRRLHALHDFLKLNDAQSLAAANKRISNILRKSGQESFGVVNAELLRDPAEQVLHEQIVAMTKVTEPLLAARDYSQALTKLASLRASVDAFFDGVMVMADDIALRNNRLALLAQLRGLFLRVADLSRLPG